MLASSACHERLPRRHARRLLRFSRNSASTTNQFAKAMAPISYYKAGNVFELLKSPPCGVWIASTCFGHDKPRRKQLIMRSSVLPPVTCHLLRGRSQNVSTRPCSKVADYGRLNVDLIAHTTFYRLADCRRYKLPRIRRRKSSSQIASRALSFDFFVQSSSSRCLVAAFISFRTPLLLSILQQCFL